MQSTLSRRAVRAASSVSDEERHARRELAGEAGVAQHHRHNRMHPILQLSTYTVLQARWDGLIARPCWPRCKMPALRPRNRSDR